MHPGYRYVLVLGLMALAAAPSVHAQTPITGTVTDAETGDSLPAVNVVTGTPPVGTATGVDGTYAITAPAGADSLVFSFIGYRRLAVAIDGRTQIDVALSPDAQFFDDVVVTALGIRRQERELGYAVQKIDAADLSAAEAGNIVNSLSGRVAGAQVTNTGGAPGQSARIILRGLTSLEPDADNQPLFVVDGIPVDNSTNTGAEGFDSRGFSNRAVDLNPNDIESVTVLKGASATALYGLRAANGAIIITTKSGQPGAPRVSITSSVGAETVNRFPETQQTYAQGFGGQYDRGSFWPAWGPPVEEVRRTDPDLPIFNNYRNAYETGYALDNNVSVSGGTEQASFFASLSNLQNDGVLPFSDWGRTSARLSGALKPSRQTRFGGTLNYINSGGDRVFADRFNERLIYWAQTVDVRDYINENGTMRGYRGEDGTGGTNPIYDARYATYTDDVNRLIGTLNLGYDPARWLTLSYRAGVDTYNDSRFQTTRGPLGFNNENALSSDGSLSETRIFSRDLTSTVNATVRQSLTDQLDAELLLGNDIFDRYRDQVFTFGSDLTIPDLFRFNNVREVQTSLFTRQQRLVGLYGALKLSYDETLYLELTGRNDWSSTLPVESRSFFYPSASLGYVFSEHVNPGNVLDYGKLRVSLAEVGKDTDPYRTSRTFGAPGIFPLNGQTGFTLSRDLGSADLVPERTTSFEIGTDLRFFDSRLRADATYYNATSRDQIIQVPISNATGFDTFVLNAGSIRNTGIEVSLNGPVVGTDDFGWEVGVNFARNRNTVVSIREGVDEIVLGSQFGYAGSSAALRLIPGQPYGAIYGTSYARYYGPGEQDDGITVNEDAPLLIGANGFPVIDSTPRILGNMTPDWTGGLLNRFRYKNVELSALLDVSIGSEKYNQYNNFFAAFGLATYTENRNETTVFEGVTADGQPNTKVVYFGQGVGPDGVNYGAGYYRNTYRASTENSVFDASYLKLRNVSVAYGVPSRLLGPTGVGRAKLRFAVTNVILWTPYEYWDPEVTSSGTGNTQGFSGLAHPGVSSYTFTLELGL